MNEYIKQWMKIHIEYILNFFEGIKRKQKYNFEDNKKYSVIFCAANYQNLGDIAITIAQKNFLKKVLPDREIICIPPEDTYMACRAVLQVSPQNILITLIGGGNNGSLYNFIERPRRYILKKLKQYRIISFPQSVFYERNIKGILYYKEFQNLCNKCDDLSLIGREESSYLIYKQIHNQSFLIPDMVFLECNTSIVPIDKRKDKVIYIFREDKEKSLLYEEQEKVIHITSEYFEEKEIYDTCSIIKKNNQEILLQEYLEKISQAKLIVTDRLHGMIFSYITRTPCIVITISNNKIESTYSTWLQNQNFIKLCQSNQIQDEYKKRLDEILSLDVIKYQDMNVYYEKLKEIIRVKKV